MTLKALPSSDLSSRLRGMSSWAFLSDAVDGGLQSSLDEACASGQCLPQPENWLRALELTEGPDGVRVVILGQDPYHGPGQAHGLAFSVADGFPIPPSLRNIYKEIARDIGGTPPVSGNLEGWARQGVLLLNDVWTVAPHVPGSHSGFGWQALTRSVLEGLAQRPVAFLLWGRHARSHAPLVRSVHPDHLILEAPHPSPLSAHKGFLGCGHFGRVNAWLTERGEAPIRWLDGPWNA